MAILKSLKSKFKAAVIRRVDQILGSPEIEQKIWNIVHRPRRLDPFGPSNIVAKLREQAAIETAAYVMKNMITTPAFDRGNLLKTSLDRVTVEGLYLEFGAGASGQTTNEIASLIDHTLHGFDSFEGLPDDWFGNLKAGSYSTQVIADYRPNVELHKGWFHESLPIFLAEHPGNVAFVHVDCDVYSSTKVVLDELSDRIVPGTIMQFDEYFNYPGWQEHEFRAFQEFVRDGDRKYTYLGYHGYGYSVAVQMLAKS